MVKPFVSFGHCIVCSSSIYWFWLPLWYLLAIVFSVLRRFTDSDYPFGIFWPLYCLFFVNLLILIAALVSFGPTDNTMAKRYQKGNRNQSIDEEHTIQWSKDTKRAIRISKSTKNRQYNGQKMPKRQSESVNRRRTENYLLAIVLSVLRRFTDSDCPCGIFWPLYCVFFVDWLILISPLVSFSHCIVCSSFIYWFWLPL
jgi:hypothetical protein